MNNDLISRSALKEALRWIEDNPYIALDKEIMQEIDNAPTVDLKDIYQEGHYDGHLEGYTKAINEERPHGEWKSEGYFVFCDYCGSSNGNNKTPFCPYCGAEMKEGEDHAVD